MEQGLYFCSPSENQYYSTLPLWGVARISEMANGTPWLEPQWVGGHGDVPEASPSTHPDLMRLSITWS